MIFRDQYRTTPYYGHTEMSRCSTAPRLRRVVKTASKGKDKDKLGSKQGFLADNGNKNVASFFGNGYWTPYIGLDQLMALPHTWRTHGSNGV